MTRRADRRTGTDVEPSLLPVVDRLVEQRSAVAAEEVARLRAEHPDDTREELANRLIRRYARDMSIAGAVSGGAAAAPVAGMAVAVASVGAETVFSVGRLGEMIMSIGLIYDHGITSADERKAAIVAVMGLADGAAVGVSGLAARAGSKGGARVLRRLPTSGAAAATGGIARRTASKLGNTKGPWSLAALVPYGIGAGVGAAGNALLARAVGRAAKEYFAAAVPRPGDVDPIVEVVDDETELLDPEPGPASANPFVDDATDIVDADIVDAEIVE